MDALRAAAVWLLIVVASGAAPVAASYLGRADDCGDTCARCWCRQRTAGHNVRAVCPCCDRQDPAAVVTLLQPAVLPASSPTLAPSLQASRLRAARPALHARPPAVPDPPPRIRFLS